MIQVRYYLPESSLYDQSFPQMGYPKSPACFLLAWLGERAHAVSIEGRRNHQAVCNFADRLVIAGRILVLPDELCSGANLFNQGKVDKEVATLAQDGGGGLIESGYLYAHSMI